MNEFINKHPYLTFFIIVSIVSAVAFTIRYTSAQKTLAGMTPEERAEFLKNQNQII